MLGPSLRMKKNESTTPWGLRLCCSHLVFSQHGPSRPLKQTFKETRSVTMNIFRKFSFLFKSFVKIELSYVQNS